MPLTSDFLVQLQSTNQVTPVQGNLMRGCELATGQDFHGVVFGGSGLLGQALVRRFDRSNLCVATPSSTEVSLLRTTDLAAYIGDQRPDFIVNAAAFTDVDESESRSELVFTANSWAVQTMLECAKRLDIRLIQISTASVFTGSQGQRFSHYAPLNPTNVYNTSKAQAEEYCFAALNQDVNVAWVRTYWLYGQGKRSFVNLVIDRLQAGERVSVVNDQWGQPTFSEDLAAVIEALVFSRDILGPLHGVNSGSASRLAWAHRIAEVLDLDASLIDAVSASDFAAIAPRPES